MDGAKRSPAYLVEALTSIHADDPR